MTPRVLQKGEWLFLAGPLLVPLHSISATRGLSSLVQNFGHAEKTGGGFQQYQPANVCHDFLFVLESILHAFSMKLYAIIAMDTWNSFFLVSQIYFASTWAVLTMATLAWVAMVPAQLLPMAVTWAMWGSAQQLEPARMMESGQDASHLAEVSQVHKNNVHACICNPLILFCYTCINIYMPCSCALWISRHTKIWCSDYSEWSFIWSESPVFL